MGWFWVGFCFLIVSLSIVLVNIFICYFVRVLNEWFKDLELSLNIIWSKIFRCNIGKVWLIIGVEKIREIFIGYELLCYINNEEVWFRLRLIV